MQICCTKKLQDEMGIVLQDGRSEDDLFCWSVHLITVNRRKTIVVVNDSSRFGFVLYGLKAKDFKNFNELLLLGIKNCMKDEKIKDEIIERYLKSGGEITYSKTRGPKYVSRINKACELIKVCNDILDSSELFQHLATREMNSDLVKIGKGYNYVYPNQLLSKDLKLIFDGEMIRCEVVDLTVKL